MATNLNKVDIKRRSSAIPTKKLIGIGKDGNVDEKYDFFKQSLQDDWWDFFNYVSTPVFNDEDLTYSIGIKSTYTCTGTDVELGQRKAEYLKKGIENLFIYFGKAYTQEIIDQFVTDTDPETNKEISRTVDYHLNGRPSSKLKFLVEVDARYLNALADKQAPSSYSNNLDLQGNLITSSGLLNPSVGSDGNLKSYDDITIVTLSSERYERELERTALYMGHLERDMITNSIRIRGIDLVKEGQRLRELPVAINSLVSENFSTDGYSAGRNEDEKAVRPELQSGEYFIRFAIKEDDKGLYQILWASYFKQGQGETFLRNGFDKFLKTNPVDNQTTIRYFFYHQQILNNLDRNIEPNFTNFLEAYHYPPVDATGLLLDRTKEVPFATKTGQLKSEFPSEAQSPYNIESDPEFVFKVGKRKCGLDFQFPFEPPSFNDLLAQLLQPLNFELGLTISFGSLGPPCPAPFTGNSASAIITEAANRLTNEILRSAKVVNSQVAEAKENIEYVGEYFTSEAYLNDLQTRANSTIFSLRQLGDLVLNQFTLDKMLKLVCICLTQIADQTLEEAGVQLQQPAGGMSIKGPGASFNPALLSDDINESGNWVQAVNANWGSFNVTPLTEEFSLTQLCSFCLNLPEFLPKFPTFDLLRNFLDLLLALLEALIVQILTSLILQLVSWLTQCPDIKCELRPNDAAADDFGSLRLPDFFPDEKQDPLQADQAGLADPPIANPPVLASCPALFGISSIDNLSEIQQSLFQRISNELSSGELLNVLEGYPTRTSLSVIKEIIETEEQFEEIRPFFDSYAKIEEFIDCLSDNVDPQKVANFLNATQNPQYCPTPDNTPLAYLRDKCDNEEQIQRFLLRESSSKAARLKGIIDGIRKDPNFFQGLIPELLSSVDPETNEKRPGLLSDEKFKPEFIDTMIEQYNPFIENINRTARREGSSFLSAIYQDGYPNSIIPNDVDLETNSVLQLGSAITLYALGTTTLATLPPAGLAMQETAKALSPYSGENEINSKYPIVGGLQLREALDSIEQNGSYSIGANQGNSSKFNGINIENKNLRQFNGRVSLEYGTTSIEVYLESITEILKSSAEANGLKNNAIIRLKSPTLLQTQNYVGFGYEVALNFDDDPELEAVEPINQLNLTLPNQLIGVNASPYSPQGYIFSQLIERGMPTVFNAMIPGIQDKFRTKLASSVHLTAFRDLIQSIGIATQNSPYFTTYVYEDLEAGVGSEGKQTKSFRRFARRDPYSTLPGFPTDDFRQKYRAKDANNGRTSVYWRPVPALQDTPLRDGKYENGECVIYFDEEQFKEQVKDKYDPFMQYDPNDLDPNNLPPLSNAILDELIPQIIKVYTLDAAIKSMPVSKIYDSNAAGVFRDKMYANVIAEIILKEIDNLKIKSKFLTQVTKWWERRYKEDQDLNVADAPVGSEGVRQLVAEYIEETIKMASEITNIKHLNENDEKITFPIQTLISNGNLSNGMFTVPNLKFEDPQAQFGQPPESQATNYTNVESLKKGGFIFETFLQVDLHDETKNYVANTLGQEFVNNLVNVPLSFDTLETAFSTIGFDDSAEEHVLKKFLSLIGQTPEQALPSELKTITKILGTSGEGLFKEFKMGVRFSYSISNNDAVENFFNEITTQSDAFFGLFEELAGKDYSEPLKAEIIKNKSFIFSEASDKVLTFPIITNLYDFASMSFVLNASYEEDPTPKVNELKGIEQENIELGGSKISNEKFVLAQMEDTLKVLYLDIGSDKFNLSNLVNDFKNKPEWKAIFRYCLSEGLASNIVSVYSYLNMIEGLGNTKTFASTKEQLLMFFQSAMIKPGLDGKPVGGQMEFNAEAFNEEETSPPPLDENGNKTSPEPKDQNNC